jgi:hypothetical protein
MNGWVKLEVGAWPSIAAAIPKPWPREAALLDLRWWENQERMGRDERPGRPALASRWGWSQKTVRSVLAARSIWSDCSVAYCEGQRRASRGPGPPERTRYNAGFRGPKN